MKGRATFKGFWRRQPAYGSEDGNIKPRNDLEIVLEA